MWRTLTKVWLLRSILFKELWESFYLYTHFVFSFIHILYLLIRFFVYIFFSNLFQLILKFIQCVRSCFLEFFCLKCMIKFAKLYDFTTCVYHICSTLLNQFCQLYRMNLSYNVYIVDTNVLASFEQLCIAKLVNSD